MWYLPSYRGRENRGTWELQTRSSIFSAPGNIKQFSCLEAPGKRKGITASVDLPRKNHVILFTLTQEW